MEGISQVSKKVLCGAGIGVSSLDCKAEHGKHGEAAVLDLLQADLLHGISGTRAHAKRIEAGIADVSASHLVALENGVLTASEEQGRATGDNLLSTFHKLQLKCTRIGLT